MFLPKTTDCMGGLFMPSVTQLELIDLHSGETLWKSAGGDIRDLLTGLAKAQFSAP